MKKQSVSIYFVDILEKLPEPDQQNKKRKYKYNMLAEKNCKNIITQQINSQKKLFTKIVKKPNGGLKIILDMPIIYTKYLNQANNVDKQYNQILTVALELKQNFQIYNIMVTGSPII